MTKEDKPVIRTLINTSALLFSGYAGAIVYSEGFTWSSLIKAMGVVLFGVLLEFIKYWGMKHKLW